MNMKKERKINIAAFIIPAVFVFFSHSYWELADRIIYSIIIGYAFYFPVTCITKGADEDFRRNAPVSEKVKTLLCIIIFPISYYLLSEYIDAHFSTYNRCVRALATLVEGIFITMVIALAVKYIIRMFEK